MGIKEKETGGKPDICLNHSTTGQQFSLSGGCFVQRWLGNSFLPSRLLLPEVHQIQRY